MADRTIYTVQLNDSIDFLVVNQRKLVYIWHFVGLRRLVSTEYCHKSRISPRGGAVNKNRLLILKERPRFPISDSLQLYVYFVPVKSYSAFSFWLGFPYCGQYLSGFGGF